MFEITKKSRSKPLARWPSTNLTIIIVILNIIVTLLMRLIRPDEDEQMSPGEVRVRVFLKSIKSIYFF